MFSFGWNRDEAEMKGINREAGKQTHLAEKSSCRGQVCLGKPGRFTCGRFISVVTSDQRSLSEEITFFQ